MEAFTWDSTAYGYYEDWDKAGKPKCKRGHPKTRKTWGKSGCKICDRELHRVRRARDKLIKDGGNA